METSTAVAPATNLFHEIQSGISADKKDSIDPRATRWVFSALWDITGIPMNAFKLPIVPGQRFLPLRPFANPVTDPDGKQTSVECTPNEQVVDLRNIAGEFVADFQGLAKLGNEALAREVLTILTNPNQCERYPIELSNTCATCWIEYLRNEAPAKLAAAYSGDDRMASVAGDSLMILLGVLERSVVEATEQVNKALRDIDDPKSGKGKRFYAVDYINIFHTHQDRPKLKTTTNQNDSLENLGKAVLQLAESRGSSDGLSADAVRRMIEESDNKKLAEAEARIAELTAELEAKAEVKAKK